MEIIYHWIGLIIFWSIVIPLSSALFSFLVYVILNLLGKHWKPLWNVIDYLNNKEDFEEWKKEQ